MKKYLFLFVSMFFMFAACSQAPQFKINGTIENLEAGTILLVKINGTKLDTLGKSAIKNGKFSLTGNVATITEAAIIIEGQKGGFPFILENANYTATLNLANPLANKIEGPATQQSLNEYTAIANEARMTQARLGNEYRAALQAKDVEKMQQIKQQHNVSVAQAGKKMDSLFHAHTNSYLGAYLLSKQMRNMNFEKLTQYFSELGEEAKASEPGQTISKEIEKLSSVQPGKVAPDFTFNTPEGEPLSMHSIKAKVKIIDFWASWCNPCRQTNPFLVQVYKEYHSKGLEILGVSLDTEKEAWVKAIADDKLTWKHVSDLKAWKCAAVPVYAIKGIPHMVLVDENNVIIAKDLHGKALTDKLAELLK